MKITQISVFLENRKGRLYEVCSLLGKNDINILALTIAETEDFGVLRTVVNKPEKAIKILKDNGFAANITDVLVVEVQDRPGGLADILKVLNDNNINIEYMHAMVTRHSNNALMVFRFDNPDEALKVLKKNNIKVITKDIIF
jgi:hypothetical protein